MNFKTLTGLILALATTSLIACSSRGEASDDVALDGPSAAPVVRSLSKGTTVVVALTHVITSRDAHAGDAFTATLVTDARDAGGSVVISVGSFVHGTITEVSAASSSTSTGRFTLEIGTVTVEEETYLIDASLGFETSVGRGVAGGAASVAVKDTNLVLPAGTRMTVTLNEDLTLSPL
jgi:hypothetical protein